MQFLVYILFYPIIYFISILPFRILYLLSDFVFLLVFHVFKYRRKVVVNNLKLALPHLSDKERGDVEKKFYKHMCDMFLEMIKTMSISDKEIEERFKFKNLDEYLELEKQNKSVALLASHYASYEWVISMNRKIKFRGFAIYKKLSNKYFDDLVKKIRSRFKADLIVSQHTKRIVEKNEIEGIRGIYGFASDQSPQLKPHIYWTNFMGIEVPVHTGAEMLSKRFDMNMVYLKVEKVKRGYYEAELEVLTTDAKSVPDYQITDTFLRKVEQQIYEKPEYYLWTHKRWKHRGKNKKAVAQESN
ncbi:lysophospholipid acyltransferase family protein [Flavobacterium sp. H122]|uniref:lysophospholipid acyltransferase family protein n=1 Tax=Flavobacterium sp. H122 TaxID=2529860 RepID=UPI0010AB42C1|nr:lysophospholipid acyltransferase family protein [Flavobacterium sp. H122]